MTVYSPAEDSYLLASALPEDLQGLKCLEIGTGSGFIAEKMLEKGAEKVTAVDINPEAVKQASQRLKDFENAEVFQSDMFQEIENSFDLIVFNPPYLPGEASEVGDEEIWSGGEKGTEVTGKFTLPYPGAPQGGAALSSASDIGAGARVPGGAPGAGEFDGGC
ncbi:MAG: HemK2/MTQ2 family protein methyltransferase [Desulfuromonadaceae bacterium]